MRQIRLLPVVIAAATALLMLKGLGIMTQGGYVLTGTQQVRAATDEGDDDTRGEPAVDLPTERTLRDSAPTLYDNAPTLPLQPRATHETQDATERESESELEAAAATDLETEPATETELADIPAIDDPFEETAEADSVAEPMVDPGVNEWGDALPLIRDDAGDIVPLALADGSSPSSEAIVERLNARRFELDQREAELDMRLALVEAAEKRINERTLVLEHLEARINAIVDEKRTLEEAQFTAVVAMYETMRPRDAAAIFDQLEMSVLVRVARAVNPRRMAPIMASMNPTKAKDLTAALAVDRVEPTIDMSEENLARLPQIVGQ